jgi:hypothetical protein
MDYITIKDRENAKRNVFTVISALINPIMALETTRRLMMLRTMSLLGSPTDHLDPNSAIPRAPLQCPLCHKLTPTLWRITRAHPEPAPAIITEIATHMSSNELLPPGASEEYIEKCRTQLRSFYSNRPVSICYQCAIPVIIETRKGLRETPTSLNHIVDDIKNIAQNRQPTLELTETPPEREHPWGSLQERDIIGSFVKGNSPDGPNRRIIALAPTMDLSRPLVPCYFISPPTSTPNPEPSHQEKNDEWGIETTLYYNKVYNESTGIASSIPKPPAAKKRPREAHSIPDMNHGASQWKKRPVKSPERTQPSPQAQKPTGPTSPPQQQRTREQLISYIQQTDDGPQWLFALIIKRCVTREDPTYREVISWLTEIETARADDLASLTLFLESLYGDMKRRTRSDIIIPEANKPVPNRGFLRAMMGEPIDEPSAWRDISNELSKVLEARDPTDIEHLRITFAKLQQIASDTKRLLTRAQNYKRGDEILANHLKFRITPMETSYLLDHDPKSSLERLRLLPRSTHIDDEVAKFKKRSEVNDALLHNARNYYPKLDPLFVQSDGNCLYHANNAAQHALGPHLNPATTLSHRDLRLLACALAKQYIAGLDPETYDQETKAEIDRAVMDGSDSTNEVLMIALASIRNGDIVTIDEMSPPRRYVPNTEMQKLLVPTPVPPKTETIFLLNRAGAHYDATRIHAEPREEDMGPDEGEPDMDFLPPIANNARVPPQREKRTRPATTSPENLEADFEPSMIMGEDDDQRNTFPTSPLRLPSIHPTPKKLAPLTTPTTPQETDK